MADFSREDRIEIMLNDMIYGMLKTGYDIESARVQYLDTVAHELHHRNHRRNA